MYELIEVGERTYYIDCPSRMGVCLMNDTDVCLIDSGLDKDVGRRILKILTERGWALKMIVNTHAHADHIGGNRFLQERAGCPAYAVGAEVGFIRHPVLSAAFYYGGYPCRELRNKFLVAPESEIAELTDDVLPAGFETVRLDGHTFSMIGLRAPDGVWFIGDALASEAVLEKYHIPVLYDPGQYLETLSRLETLKGCAFVLSHTPPTDDLGPLISANRDKIGKIVLRLKEICAIGMPFEEILKAVFDGYGLTMDMNQYALVGSTIRSFLSYLYDKGEVTAEAADNRMLWRTLA